MRWRARLFLPLALAAVPFGLGPHDPLRAQTPPEGPAPLQLSGVETELLRVEAVVLDKAGRPVKGLSASDFRVLEDGQPQEVTHFQPARGRAAPDPAREEPKPEEKPADERAADPGAGPAEERHIVLAVDDLHLSPTSMAGAKVALKRFVAEQAADNDQIAVVTTSGALGLLQAFTGERAVLRRAIDRGDSEALRLSTTELSLREQLNTGRAQGVVNPRSAFEASGQARALLAQALDVSNMTLRTLESVVRSLGTVRGRKLLVLVSDGFVVGQGTQDPRAFDMRRIFDASARAGVAVYALDSRGVNAEPIGGDASKAANPDQTAPAGREGYKRMGEAVMRDSLAAVAEGTGGFLVHGTNDLATGLDLILADSDSGYLLAYSPRESVRDGRYRRIEIEVVGHPDYTVRARKGYFAPDDGRPEGKPAPAGAKPGTDPRRDQELRAALASLLPLSGVPLRMAADFFDQPPLGTQLVVRAEVDVNGLPFVTAGDRRRANVEVIGIIYGENGEVVGDVEGHRVDLDLSPATFKLMQKDGLRYQKAVPLKPGLYQVRMVAREEQTSKLGTAFQWIEIPDVHAGPLTLSSVFLFADESPGTSGAPASPPPNGPPGLRDVQVQRRFEPGSNLYYWIYAYNPARDEKGATDVVVQTQVFSARGLQGASPVTPVAFGEATAPPQPVTGRITLEGLAPGDYELRVLVVDRKANANALRRVSFSIG